MKKILSIILLITCLVSSLALTSCDNGNGGSETPKTEFQIPEGGYNGEEVTITFYHSMGQKLTEHVTNAIGRFNAIYPNITIELAHYSDYDSVRDQIVTEISAGGTDANIAFCYPDHVALYNSSKATVSLDALINSDIQITTDAGTATLGFTDEERANFVEAYYKEGAIGDTMYSIPFSKSTEIMFYNKTFFDANGLTPPTTWDELETVCQAIKAIDSQCVPFGYDSEANWFITMCEQYGTPYTSTEGDNYLFNNSKNHEIVARLRGWYQSGLVTTKELSGAYTSDKFKDGSLYMCVGSSAGAIYQMATDFEVGIAPIPQADPTNPKAISQGPSLCIFNKTNSTEVVASWLFAKFLSTDEELQCRYSMNNGYVPVIKSAYENATYKNEFLADANGKTGLPALVVNFTIAHANETFTSPVFRGSAKARDQVGILLQTCLGGNKGNSSDMDFIKEKFEEALYECKFGK